MIAVPSIVRRASTLAVVTLIVPLTTISRAQPPAGSRPIAAGTAQLAAAPAGNAANGKALYLAHQCWACHGYTGETGTRLIREDGGFSARLVNVSSFIGFIRAPRPNDPPPVRSTVTMPSYGVSSLPDAQAGDLYAYIRSFKSTQPALTDIPLLNQMLRAGESVKK